MARYYESETLIEFVKKYTPHINGESTLECVERAIREAPTADVVPKSEVEELKQIYQKYNKAIKHERAEVAREIFEEIEKIIQDRKDIEVERQGNNKIMSPFTYSFGALELIEFQIAELKKKYIKGEKENEN